MTSFAQQYNMGLVIRPIRLSKRTSLHMVIDRINFDLQTCLYKFATPFKGFNTDTGEYDIDMGLGLASTRNISHGSRIVYFCGEVLDKDGDEYKERWENGNRR